MDLFQRLTTAGAAAIKLSGCKQVALKTAHADQFINVPGSFLPGIFVASTSFAKTKSTYRRFPLSPYN